MSSSDSEVETKKQKKGTKSAKVDGSSTSYAIKPAKGGATLDTSTWPLLLKASLYQPIYQSY